MFAVPSPLAFSGSMAMVTPRPHRRHSLVDPSSLMRAPVKKERRPSLTQTALNCLCTQPQSSLQSQSNKCSQCLRHIRKRLDFCVSTESSSRKRANSLFAALHSGNDAVPLSELEVARRKRVRFTLSEMLDEAPGTPETPMFEPRIYKYGPVQEEATPTGSKSSDLFTKLSSSFPVFSRGRSLFNDASTEIDGEKHRPTARNLKFMA